MPIPKNPDHYRAAAARALNQASQAEPEQAHIHTGEAITLGLFAIADAIKEARKSDAQLKVEQTLKGFIKADL